MSFLPLVRFWIWISVFASVAGWTLSALGQLNRPGDAAFLAVFAVLVWVCRKELGFVPGGRISRKTKFLRRFRRPLPFCFAALVFLIFLGGVIYPPTNYTGLTYHVPRVLHWLAEGRWHWIHTSDNRMNYSGCDFEWLFAPLLLFAKSDRALFLFNFTPFLLLPGLVFSAFTRLGVHPRVAWQWMWVLPTGYNFLLQAGSTANDAVSAVYALAAVDFACRAWESRQPRDGWLSLLAVALLTGTKPTSLPLLLPWLILVFPLLARLRLAWLSALSALALAVLVSFFPVALMNKLHAGDWLGTSVESSRLEMHQPLVGILGNGFELLQDNIVPPLFPAARWWDQHVLSVIPHAWVADFQDGFFATGELPTEDWAGVGFGVAMLALVAVVASLLMGRSANQNGAVSGRSRPWCAAAFWPRRGLRYWHIAPRLAWRHRHG